VLADWGWQQQQGMIQSCSHKPISEIKTRNDCISKQWKPVNSQLKQIDISLANNRPNLSHDI